MHSDSHNGVTVQLLALPTSWYTLPPDHHTPSVWSRGGPQTTEMRTPLLHHQGWSMRSLSHGQYEGFYSVLKCIVETLWKMFFKGEAYGKKKDSGL